MSLFYIKNMLSYVLLFVFIVRDNVQIKCYQGFLIFVWVNDLC